MKNVVVTGASSMLGASLINRLLQSDEIKSIYAIVQDKCSKKIARIKRDDHIHIIECGIADYSKLAQMINEKVDVFYHMAWPRTSTYEEDTNDILVKCDALYGVIESVRIAKALGCDKYICAGSQAEYGVPVDGYYTEEMICEPIRIDGIARLTAYKLAERAAKNLNIKFVWMRVFSVYGVNDRDNSMISSTIQKLISGEHCSFTKLEQTWDYLNYRDAAEAFFLVGEKEIESHVYNLANGSSRPLYEYVEIIKKIVAPDALLGIGELPYPKNPIMKMDVDVSKLQHDTGWMPQISFEQGIREIYDSVILNNHRKRG